MADTTKTQIADEVNYVYNRNLLIAAKPLLLHTKWAQVRDIPANSGTASIRFSRYSYLDAVTTALSEGVTPSGSQLSRTFVTATVLNYGDYVTITDKVLMETLDPELTIASRILGQQAGNTFDKLTRAILAATTTIQYASVATAENEISAVMKLTYAEVKEAVRTLQGNNAQKMTTMIDPSSGYNTMPIPACFVGIVSEKTLFDLKDDSHFTPVEKYPSREGLMEGEVGCIDEVRFVMTTNAYYTSATGSEGNNVHYTIIIAADAYGISRISGHALENIIKPLGSGGTADPLDQRTTSGWKGSFVAKILNEDFLVAIYHGVTA